MGYFSSFSVWIIKYSLYIPPKQWKKYIKTHIISTKHFSRSYIFLIYILTSLWVDKKSSKSYMTEMTSNQGFLKVKSSGPHGFLHVGILKAILIQHTPNWTQHPPPLSNFLLQFFQFLMVVAPPFHLGCEPGNWHFLFRSLFTIEYL